MTNHPHRLTPRPLKATGPLGLCLLCLSIHKGDPEQPVTEAVTLAPTTIPLAAPNGQLIGVTAVAVPTCEAHLAAPQQPAQSRLLIANGEVPRA